ncbi:DUF397 domain-containing protein [Streptomyces sp. NPDC086787]|uniref:DUF397 domain-containing protein n=1 Tax=Streptomyces sp. NPDC086787 TaxID=3365759 RepID=UPI003806A0BB
MKEIRSLTAPQLNGADWRKSSYSGSGEGQCVEVAANLIASHGGIAVRDSKNPGGAVLLLEQNAFVNFIDEVREGRFNA